MVRREPACFHATTGGPCDAGACAARHHRSRDVRGLLRPAALWPAARVEPFGMTEAPELDDVTAEQRGVRRVGPTTRSFREKQRELVEVVRPRHPPAEEAAQGAGPITSAMPLYLAERGHLADHPELDGRGSPWRFFASAAPAGARAGTSAESGSRLRASGTRAQSAERPHVLVAAHAQQLVHLDASALVQPVAQLADERMRPHAGCPDERPRRDACPVAENGLVRVQRRERRVDPDPHAALRQLVRGRSPPKPRRQSRGGSSAQRRRAPSAAGRPSGSGSSGPRRRRDPTAPPAPRRPRSPRRRTRRTARRSRSSSSRAASASSSWRSTWLRRWIASASDLKERACSVQSRYRQPSAAPRRARPPALPERTVWAPASVSIAVVRASRSTAVARPSSSSVCAHIARSGTIVWRGSSVPGCGLREQRRVEHEVLRRDDRRPALSEQAWSM